MNESLWFSFTSPLLLFETEKKSSSFGLKKSRFVTLNANMIGWPGFFSFAFYFNQQIFCVREYRKIFCVRTSKLEQEFCFKFFILSIGNMMMIHSFQHPIMFVIFCSCYSCSNFNLNSFIHWSLNGILFFFFLLLKM